MADSIIATNIPANSGYGQNGFNGPSSDLPGKNTTSGLLPRVTIPDDQTQVRKLSADAIPSAHGMRNVSANPVKIATKLSRA